MRVAAACLFVLTSCSTAESIREQPYLGDAWPGRRPEHGIAPASLAIVTNSRSDDLSLLDLTRNQVVATTPVDFDPIALDAPHHIAMTPSGEFIFVPLAYPPPTAALGPHGQHGASLLPGIILKLRTSDLSRVSTVTVEQNPGDAVMTPDGTRLLVSHFDLKKAIDGIAKGRPLQELRAAFFVIETSTMAIVRRIYPCIAGHGVAVAPDGKRAYISCYGEDAIAAVSLDDNTYASELWPLGSSLATPPDIVFGPYFVTVTPRGDALIVSETERKELRIIDLASRKTIATVDTRGAAFGPASTADGATWIAATQSPDTLVTVDAASWSVTSTRTMMSGECEKPHQVARRGDRWFVVCEGDWKSPSKILEIDPKTLATIRSFTVGAYPDAIIFGPETR